MLHIFTGLFNTFTFWHLGNSYIDMQWTVDGVDIPAEEVAPESIYVEAPAGKPEKPT